MTRKSKREIESALESVAGDEETSTTRQWVREYLRGQLEAGFELKFTPADDVDKSESVCILDTDAFEYYVSPVDIPEWIDAEADLPVEGMSS